MFGQRVLMLPARVLVSRILPNNSGVAVPVWDKAEAGDTTWVPWTRYGNFPVLGRRPPGGSVGTSRLGLEAGPRWARTDWAGQGLGRARRFLGRWPASHTRPGQQGSRLAHAEAPAFSGLAPAHLHTPEHACPSAHEQRHRPHWCGLRRCV